MVVELSVWREPLGDGSGILGSGLEAIPDGPRQLRPRHSLSKLSSCRRDWSAPYVV
jgi:hypothetical protein